MAPAPGTEAADVEAAVADLGRKAGKVEADVARDLGYLRRTVPEDRVRYCLQTVELKAARGKPAREPHKLFWFLVYHPGERGEEGADANRVEHRANLARLGEGPGKAPAVVASASPKAPATSEPKIGERHVARPVGPSDDVLRLRAEMERDRAADAARRERDGKRLDLFFAERRAAREALARRAPS